MRQTLADGVTVHPYYPNVVPRKRVRYSYFVSSTQYIRFVGYIKSWQPAMEGGVLGTVTLTAADRFDLLSRVFLDSPIREETADDMVTVQYPLTEPAGATYSLSTTGSSTVGVVSGGPALLFGDAGPGYGEGTGVKFSPSAASSGQYLRGTLPVLNLNVFTFEMWVNPGKTAPAWGSSSQNLAGFDDALGNYAALIYMVNGSVGFQGAAAPGGTGLSSSILDGAWHHIAVTKSTPTGNATLYVDGAVVGSTSTNPFPGLPPVASVITIGESASPYTYSAARFQGNVGYVGLYTTALSAARVAVHSAATTGFDGDTTDARIARWLTDGGLTSSDWNLDVGVAVVGTYAQSAKSGNSGKDIVTACQDMALTEAGGAAVYVDTDGRIRFVNRNSRNPAAPVITVDAALDLDNGVYAPSVDELTLLNMSTGNRTTESGTQTSQVAQDLTSQGLYGLATDNGFTSYSKSDSDVLQTAQWRVASNAYPGFRLAQVQVNLMTAATALYTSLAAVKIGSRLRVTSVPTVAAPLTTVDLIIEGWTETASTDSYLVTFDTTPADNPAVGLWDDNVYGRWQAAGATLNASVTAAATSLAIATSGPTWSTAAGDYPMSIVVNEEIIQLNTAPAGSTSPQTFTGVTRGVSGSTAAAQAAGAGVDVYQTVTFGL
jgi:hypothetical protein